MRSADYDPAVMRPVNGASGFVRDKLFASPRRPVLLSLQTRLWSVVVVMIPRPPTDAATSLSRQWPPLNSDECHRCLLLSHDMYFHLMIILLVATYRYRHVTI